MKELDQAHQFQLAQKHRKKQSTKEHEQKVKEIIEGQYEEARLEEEIIEQAKVQKAQKINQFNSNQKVYPHRLSDTPFLWIENTNTHKTTRIFFFFLPYCDAPTR